MGSTLCQQRWALVYEQNGATAEALEDFFGEANEQGIKIPPPMFQAKRRLEEIKKDDEKIVAHFQHFNEDARLAEARRQCAEAGTHLSTDPRVKAFIAAHWQQILNSTFGRAKQERKQQAEASNSLRRAELHAAITRNKQSFGTTDEKIKFWLCGELRECRTSPNSASPSIADLTENQFAHLLHELENPWWWDRGRKSA
jgi:hypothetical protein